MPNMRSAYANKHNVKDENIFVNMIGAAIPVFGVCLLIVFAIWLIYLMLGKSKEEQNDLWIAGSSGSAGVAIVIGMLIGTLSKN